MGGHGFADLPTEILQNVCRSLVEDDNNGEDGAKRGLLSLSRASKRLRTIAVSEIFKEISPIQLDPHALSGPFPFTAFIGLLRTFITNAEIAAEVKDIATYPLGRRRMSADDYEIISARAVDLGVAIPKSVHQDACKAAAERTLWTEAAGLEDGEASQFLVEMIMAHTPNVRSIDYRVCNEFTFFQTLSSASKAVATRPLLLKLKDFHIENLGPANGVQPLTDAAPKLDSLWLHCVHGPVSGLQHERVRVLLLTMAMFLAEEMRDLMVGFPGVKKLWLGWTSRSLLSPVNSLPWCSPQQAVDALAPAKTQLTELTLRFFHWQRYHLDPRTEPLRGCVASFKSLEALERLDVDAVTLYDPRHELYERSMYNASIARRFEKLLPQSLKTLVLIDMVPGPVDDDLMVFASGVGGCCPLLKKIEYQRLPSRKMRMPTEELEELKDKFAAHGVFFEDLTDNSFRALSWRSKKS